MKITVACLTLLFLITASSSYAFEPKDKYLNNTCHATAGIPWKTAPAAEKSSKKKKKKKQDTAFHDGTNGYPGREAIVPSNKLALPAGKSLYANGELVYISGRVLDVNCVPVSDAIVDIWQTDTDGKYVRSTLGDRLSPAPNFAGTGRAVTDNLGRFNFVTVFPGTSANRAPFIHVHVIQKDFPALDTEMFFVDDRRNGTDPVFSSLSAAQREQLSANVWEREPGNAKKGLGATWDIVLNGKNPWRHF